MTMNNKQDIHATYVSDDEPVAYEIDSNNFPVLPSLEIIRCIGAGGFGTCYLAKQQPLDRLVAVKTLHAELSDDPQFVERFKREMKILAGFQHPNIVQIYTASFEPPLYYVMEYVANEENEPWTLAHLLEEKGKLDATTVKQLALQILADTRQKDYQTHQSTSPGCGTKWLYRHW